MTNKLKWYVSTVILLGIAYFFYTINAAIIIDIKGVIIFTVLSIIAESLLIPTSGVSAVSVAFAISFAAILVLGAPEAAWIACLGVILRVTKLQGKYVHIFNVPVYKTLFNGANLLLSVGIAGYFYQALGGTPGTININTFVFPVVVSMLVYVFIDETIISLLTALLTGEVFTKTWFSNLLWASRDCIFIAPLGILMAIGYTKYSTVGTILFLAPLLLARYSYKLYVDMKRIYIETVKSLSQAIEAKDPYTKGHSMRVSDYACELAKKMNLSSVRIENLKMAAILHDIGKIGIEENILNKPGKLTDEEFDRIKQHPLIGVKIIQDIEFLKGASDIIIGHHEKLDGTGYPYGRKQKEINLEAAILCIADVFDALTSDRPYRQAMTAQQALTIIKDGKGKHFDAKLADVFIRMVEEQKGLKTGGN